MDWIFLVGRGKKKKKSHKKLRFIFIRNGKGQKDQNIMKEERGRSGGRRAEGIQFQTRPVGAAEKRPEKNGLRLQTVTSARLHKRPPQHTLHTRAHTHTPRRVFSGRPTRVRRRRGSQTRHSPAETPCAAIMQLGKIAKDQAGHFPP